MSGEKIEQAREAAKSIVGRLGSEDRVALVQYDDHAQVVLPLTSMDSEGRADMAAAIEGIYVGGSTNIGDGLTLGRDELMDEVAAGRVSRLILLSDGKANVGITDPS